MRPRGDVRQALCTSAQVLAGERGCFTGREAAMHACVGYEHARLTLKDMVQAGELVVIGHARKPGVSRPLNVYAPMGLQQQAADTAAAGQVPRCWAEFR